VLDTAEDLFDLVGADVSVELLEGDQTSQCSVRLLEPAPGLFGGSEDLLDPCRDAPEPQQAIGFVRAEPPLFLSPGQGAGRDVENPEQRLLGN
jgi:hypothetical protein